MSPMLRLITLAGLLAAVACASDKTREDTGDDSGSFGSGSATTRSAAPSSDITTGTPTATSGLPGGRVFYFEFDSSELKPDGMALVDEWAAYLNANPGTKLRLEGHADERGTREYNVGLGERRANTVQQALTSRGVSAGQFSVASFGEERPVAMGHDEGAWSQNRRVELVQ